MSEDNKKPTHIAFSRHGKNFWRMRKLILCAVAACLLGVTIAYASKFIAANKRTRNMQDLTDACLENVEGASFAQNDMLGSAGDVSSFGVIVAPWNSSQPDRIMQSATPAAVKFCTCISQKFIDRNLYSLAKHAQTFRAAAADAAKECGGATSDDERSRQLRLGGSR